MLWKEGLWNAFFFISKLKLDVVHERVKECPIVLILHENHFYLQVFKKSYKLFHGVVLSIPQ